MASPSKPYDVFLSFRGRDVRDNIVSHLHEALIQRGIRTFIDDMELNKGERISLALMKAIEESHIAVIIFSENYASSSWCLDELVHIMRCKGTSDLSVLPVFYKVEPREVREGRNKYKEAFDKHENKYGKDSEDVNNWKEALQNAGNLSGWEFNVWVVSESTNGIPIQLESRESKLITEFTKGTPIQLGNREFKDEAQLVQSIVREVWIQLDARPLDVAKYPVGIDSRVNELISKFNLKSQDEVLTIGLWSMGGMGKTTLAKALYNSLFRDFQGSAFLNGIIGTLQETDNMVRLQEKLLRQILMSKDITLTSDAQGSNSIAHTLRCRRVLLILDGVDNKCQINCLAKSHDWFGKGSKIIITTTNKSLLHSIKAFIHEVEALQDHEARELFKKYASGDENKEIEGDLVDRALQCTQRLPLALEVLGSAFASAKGDRERKLNKFTKSSDKTINSVLKISYDGLDYNEREIFLHIACFFNGWSRKYVEGVLENCDLHAASGVDDLIERSLIRDENGTLQVHDLIELMGKEIVDQECHDNPSKRSRVWRHHEVIDVLSRDEGSNTVKAIVLALPKPENIDIGSNAFAKLNLLRFVVMINVHTSFQGPICLPCNELRWFEWPECRASSLTFTSTPKKLTVLAVRRSLIKELGEP